MEYGVSTVSKIQVSREDGCGHGEERVEMEENEC